jgi:hypothetical protein
LGFHTTGSPSRNTTGDRQASLILGDPEITENKLILGPFQSYFRDMGKYGKYEKYGK